MCHFLWFYNDTFPYMLKAEFFTLEQLTVPTRPECRQCKSVKRFCPYPLYVKKISTLLTSPSQTGSKVTFLSHFSAISY